MIYRTGRRNTHTIYAQTGPEPTDHDPYIGSTTTPERAAALVERANAGMALSPLAHDDPAILVGQCQRPIDALVAASYLRDSIADAIANGDATRLEHSGLLSTLRAGRGSTFPSTPRSGAADPGPDGRR